MKKYFLATMAMLALPLSAHASCPAITVADMKGVADGAYPQQFEKAEFEAVPCHSRQTRTVPR
ncbi:MAG: hypothetical protein VW619_05925 [Rhodobiaceae bacterium]